MKYNKKNWNRILNTNPVNSSIDPLRHCPRCGPCMMLAGRLDAPSGSECATSSINSTEGPPRLVLRLDSILGPCLWLRVSSLIEEVSPLLDPSLFPSESEVPASGPCVEPELSLRNRPMIDFGCFGFSIPPMMVRCLKWWWRGEKRKKQMR